MKIGLTLLVLLLASAEDMKHLLISNAFAVLIMIFCGKPQVLDGIVVLLIWFISVLFVSLFNLPLPFGAGDAKLLAALAFSFGLSCCFKTFAIAAVLSGTAAILILFIFKVLKLQKPEEIPFAPFITAGFAITVLFPFF